MKIPEWRINLFFVRCWLVDWRRGLLRFAIYALVTTLAVYGALRMPMPCVTWTETCAEPVRR